MQRPLDPATLRIDVPHWIDELVAAQRGSLTTPEARMDLAIALSRGSVEHGGSPFGAVVCAGDQVIAGGANLVLSSGFSLAHAEIVTLLRAQQVLATGVDFPRPYTLYTSAEPCCQCFGAFVWSGIDELVCGATTADVERIGFDEGPKPSQWDRVLEAKGFKVVQEMQRAQAVTVLELYRARGGALYGPCER
ncbi:MAG: nucleoside deaminase [Myxococcales bacterium]